MKPLGFRLLDLPAEVRLLVYEYLLTPAPQTSDVSYFDNDLARVCSYHCDSPTDIREATLCNKVLMIRSQAPEAYQQAQIVDHRQPYLVRTGTSRSQCTKTTYVCINTPDIQVEILRTCRQLYHEAIYLLYRPYIFDFGIDVEACVPFLTNLSQFARSHVRWISVVKRDLTTVKDFDRCEWRAMCYYLSEDTKVERVSLDITAGKPVQSGWTNVEPFSEEEIGSLMQLDDMSWVREVLEIASLRALDVLARPQHCPDAKNSTAMAFYITFSASIEGSFASWLADKLRESIVEREEAPALP